MKDKFEEYFIKKVLKVKKTSRLLQNIAIVFFVIYGLSVMLLLAAHLHSNDNHIIKLFIENLNYVLYGMVILIITILVSNIYNLKYFFIVNFKGDFYDIQKPEVPNKDILIRDETISDSDYLMKILEETKIDYNVFYRQYTCYKHLINFKNKLRQKYVI